jgi:hypothetical protein
MLKILYAADNRPSSFYNLKRFLDSYTKYYSIKVAAYSSSIRGINVNWNLDALLDFTGKSKGITFKNTNFALYIREVKRFMPDLIISDLDIYTSYIGLELGVPVWQVSPLLLYYGAPDKASMYKYYSGVLSKDIDRNKYVSYVIGNSDKRLVLSHMGDVPDRPNLSEGYDWVRPNYNIIDSGDKLLYTPATSMHLADAYFSQKLTVPTVDYSDPESIVTSQYNCKYGLSVSSDKNTTSFTTTINSDVRFLSQYLRELDI